MINTKTFFLTIGLGLFLCQPVFSEEPKVNLDESNPSEPARWGEAKYGESKFSGPAKYGEAKFDEAKWSGPAKYGEAKFDEARWE